MLELAEGSLPSAHPQRCLNTQCRERSVTAESPILELSDLYITDELDGRPAGIADYRQEMLAILELAGRMADDPEAMLGRFVELAMEITGATSAGISLYEPDPPPGVFRWRYLRGQLARFEDALTPRNYSPCGVTLDQKGPVLSRHPERAYNWIADANIVVPEVLLVPLYIVGTSPLGTLWIVSEREQHFHREHARAMTELASFVGAGLRLLDAARKLQQALDDQQTLAKEMSHRIKNMFAITEGLIRMSAKGAADKHELVAAVSGRLQALASAHSLVSRHLLDVGAMPRIGDLRAIIRAVVAPHDGKRRDGSSKFVLIGPEVLFGDGALSALALIFHELATNAAKYGALSLEDGCVNIEWTQEGGELVIEWVERGGPALQAPRREGFGSTLIKTTIQGQFAGSITRTWRDDGLMVVLRIDRQRLGV
jgi:two-component sensor histidine kinase